MTGGSSVHDPGASPRDDELPTRVIDHLVGRAETIAVAESLTGGLVTAALVSVPGASAVVRGGVVAYATDLKHTLLDVDAGLLSQVGAIHAEVALALARGARARLGAVHGLGTTGVAGPDPQDGHPVGTVHVAISGPLGDRTEPLLLAGDRQEIRVATVGAVLRLLWRHLEETSGRGGVSQRT